MGKHKSICHYRSSNESYFGANHVWHNARLWMGLYPIHQKQKKATKEDEKIIIKGNIGSLIIEISKSMPLLHYINIISVCYSRIKLCVKRLVFISNIMVL